MKELPLENELFPAFPEDLGSLDAREYFFPPETRRILAETRRILDTWIIKLFELEKKSSLV